MMTYFKIAWRNLWRNKRRTLITSASIFFGVFFAIFMSSVQQGTMQNMVDNMVSFYTGYLQIQEEQFNENRSINNSFIPNEYLINSINSHNAITQYAQRLESFALAASELNSFGSMILGIQPEKEDAISGLSKWIIKGNFITPGSKDVLLGKVLAENLKLVLNDTVVLIGQGYHGVSAAGKYRVAGLLDFPLAELSRQVVYMDISNCQELFSLPGHLTSIVLMVSNPDEVQGAATLINQDLPDELRIYRWDELQPELVNLIEGKLASGKIIKGLLFMIIGFGVWGTIIMLMSERKRELGVLIALGMRKTRLTIMIIIESAYIGILGILLGVVVSLPLVWHLFINPLRVGGKIGETYTKMGFEPIIAFSMQPEVFYSPAITIFIMFAIISIYEIWYIAKLKAVIALRA